MDSIPYEKKKMMLQCPVLKHVLCVNWQPESKLAELLMKLHMVDVGWCFLRICPQPFFISPFFFSTKMADKAFDIQLILDCSGTA